MSERDSRGRFRRGTSGNPKGRPLGKARQLLDAKADDLLGRMIALAEGGDVQALTWCCNRLLPPLKAASPPVAVTLPDGALSEQGRAILAELARGTLTADECSALIGALVAQHKLVEQSEVLPMLERLESEWREGRNHPDTDK